jgi:hypothetical protein
MPKFAAGTPSTSINTGLLLPLAVPIKLEDVVFELPAMFQAGTGVDIIVALIDRFAVLPGPELTVIVKL